MKLQNKDFIEIEFTAKTKEGDLFDSNIKEDLDKMESKMEAKPFVMCLGEGMFLKGVEDFLVGKDIGKHKIELTAENAFGLRKPELVRIIPMKVFHQQKVNPVPGSMFNFDGKIAKILTVSGGRVRADFNNPIAGKDVVYDVNVVRKVEDINEKIKAFNEFLFRRDLKFEIKDKKLILETEKGMSQFVILFKDKFKELFDLDVEVNEKEGEKTPKTPQ